MLKPGQCFAVYEWCMTDAYNPKNEEHKRIKVNLEVLIINLLDCLCAFMFIHWIVGLILVVHWP